MSRLFSTAVVSLVLVTGTAALGSLISTGEDGINSRHPTVTLFDGITQLTGDGVTIGQVEPNRPGRPMAAGGSDDAAHSNSSVRPTSVTLQEGDPVTANMNIGNGHATRVAGVMISTDVTDNSMPPNGDAPRGVAINAELHSSAYITAGAGAGYTDAILTTQYIASLTGMRAINHSWGKPKLMPDDILDGNSQATLGLDWIASRYDVLNIVSGYQGVGTGTGVPIPTDNFNGMTIGRSSKVGAIYRQVSTGNNFSQDAEGDRTSISLLAPGDAIELADLGDAEFFQDGSSFAAPHVTGTVALLQQYGDERIAAAAPNWNPNARRHEVMKAVLMNSADKLIDDGSVVVGGNPVAPGNLLGMTRTVLKQDGASTFLDSFAYDDTAFGPGESIPLDEEMGTGHLNASRALTQFLGGEYDADGADVPVIGWDYGTTTGEDDFNRYRFGAELRAGSFISITLAWDRHVEFAIDADMDGEYDIGDTFETYVDAFPAPPDDEVINDLDLYLLPRNAPNLGSQIAASVAKVGTVEHLFFQIPETGEYEFWVQQFDQEDFSASQDYAVAWWAAAVETPRDLGDYNGDTIVDIQDYNLWRSSFGSMSALAADGSGNGIIDAADYTVWRDNLGATLGTGSVAAVPEPGAVGLMLVAAGVVGTLSRKRRG